MQWPSKWDQSALGTALAAIGFLISIGALVRSRWTEERVTARLVSGRLVGVLAELVRAGDDITDATTKTAMTSAIKAWRREAATTRPLLEERHTHVSKTAIARQLVVIAGMITDSIAQIEANVAVADATKELRTSVGAAVDAVRSLRTSLEIGLPK